MAMIVRRGAPRRYHPGPRGMAETRQGSAGTDSPRARWRSSWIARWHRSHRSARRRREY